MVLYVREIHEHQVVRDDLVLLLVRLIQVSHRVPFLLLVPFLLADLVHQHVRLHHMIQVDQEDLVDLADLLHQKRRDNHRVRDIRNHNESVLLIELDNEIFLLSGHHEMHEHHRI